MDFDDTNLRHVMFMPVTALSSYCRAKCSKVAETLCNTLTRKEKKKKKKKEEETRIAQLQRNPSTSKASSWFGD